MYGHIVRSMLCLALAVRDDELTMRQRVSCRALMNLAHGHVRLHYRLIGHRISSLHDTLVVTFHRYTIQQYLEMWPMAK